MPFPSLKELVEEFEDVLYGIRKALPDFAVAISEDYSVERIVDGLKKNASVVHQALVDPDSIIKPELPAGVIRDEHQKPVAYYCYVQGRGEIPCPLVTESTTVFNREVLVSAASYPVIALNPQSQELQNIYQDLKRHISARHLSSTQDILSAASETTQSLFTDTHVKCVAEKYLEGAAIPLEAFIKAKVGMDRHRVLLNAYLLSRLKEDRVIRGETKIFSIDKQLLNLFYSYEDGNFYFIHSSSTQTRVFSRDADNLKSTYGSKTANKLQSFAKENAGVNNQGIISAVKDIIQTKDFIVGQYCLFQGGTIIQLEDGTSKRVPHRIAEIYCAIQNHPFEGVIPNMLLNSIEKFAMEALEKPRPHQHQTTRDIYQTIIDLVRAETTISNMPTTPTSVASPSLN